MLIAVCDGVRCAVCSVRCVVCNTLINAVCAVCAVVCDSVRSNVRLSGSARVQAVCD
jgi:hypothetical protein